MTVHVLHVGNGYTYLTRSVAACDARLGRSEALADYYLAKGQPPGRWAGRGAATPRAGGGGGGAAGGVGGLECEAGVGILVGGAPPPDADDLAAGLVASGASPEA